MLYIIYYNSYITYDIIWGRQTAVDREFVYMDPFALFLSCWFFLLSSCFFRVASSLSLLASFVLLLPGRGVRPMTSGSDEIPRANGIETAVHPWS